MGVPKEVRSGFPKRGRVGCLVWGSGSTLRWHFTDDALLFVGPSGSRPIMSFLCRYRTGGFPTSSGMCACFYMKAGTFLFLFRGRWSVYTSISICMASVRWWFVRSIPFRFVLFFSVVYPLSLCLGSGQCSKIEGMPSYSWAALTSAQPFSASSFMVFANLTTFGIGALIVTGEATVVTLIDVMIFVVSCFWYLWFIFVYIFVCGARVALGALRRSPFFFLDHFALWDTGCVP